MTESCVPQQSIHNDCSIFTGLISVFGSEATTITIDSILELFHFQFPSFRLRADASSQVSSLNEGNNSNRTMDIMINGRYGNEKIVNELIQYGITRLNVSA